MMKKGHAGFEVACNDAESEVKGLTGVIVSQLGDGIFFKAFPVPM